MELEHGKFCPLIKKECIELKCSWFTKVVGTNINSGKEIDEYGCAIAWMPILMIENSNQQRHTSAAVDSLRNHSVTSAEHISTAINKLAKSNKSLKDKSNKPNILESK